MGPVSGGTGMVGMGVGSASAMGQGYGPMPRPGPLPTSEANVGYSAPGQYGAIASSGPGSWGGQGFDARLVAEFVLPRTR